ncbi:MAG: glutathione S-transferase family protein [Nannocystaceae bacterium]
MLRLFQVPPDFGLPSASPFCCRVEVFLKLAGIAYESEANADPRKAPKGKVPWIEDGERVLGDSSFIVDYLTTKHNVQLDARLTASQRGAAHCLKRMLTETFYWYIIQARWIEPQNWALYRQYFLRILPPVVGTLMLPMIRKSVKSKIKSHGIGLHTRDEIWQMCRADIDALAGVLGEQDYFFGDTLTSVDGDVYTFISGLLFPPFETPGRSYLQEQEKLIAHCRRVHDRVFPEVAFPA